MSRSELDGLNEVVQRHGGEGRRAVRAEDGGWARTDREVPQRGADRRGQRRARGVRRRPAAVRRRHARRSRPPSLGGLRLELAERFGLIPEGRHDPLWVIDFPMFECDEGDGAALGRAAPPVHRARRATSTTRRRCARAPTTSCSTASRSAAARSASTHPRSSRRSSSSSGMRRGGGARALRLPARGAALRRAAARRHRVRHRPDRGARLRPRLDPRRDRVPEDGQRRRPADGRPGARRRAPAEGSGAEVARPAAPGVVAAAHAALKRSAR